MWRAVGKIIKHYSTPQNSRVFSTNSCCYNVDCEDNDCDTFGNLDGPGLTKLESLVKVAAEENPFNTAFNKYVEKDSSLNHKKQEKPPVSEVLSKYRSESYVQQLHSFDENKPTASSDLREIVSDSSKKLLKKKFRAEKQKEIVPSETLTIFDHDGTRRQAPKDDVEFRKETYEQYTPYVFHKKIERLLKEDKKHEAIAVFEKEMPERNVKPDAQIYGIAIGMYAHWGYTERAFAVYKKIKETGTFTQKRAITSLFNACALSPWPKQDGLPRAISLRKELDAAGYNFNNTQYCSMMKAYGRAGDIEGAFGIVDEMAYKGMFITTRNFNFLLQACISDEQAGFRHASMLWKKMHTLNLKPDIFSYNLFLRCIRDCKSGDRSLFDDLVKDMNVIRKGPERDSSMGRNKEQVKVENPNATNQNCATNDSTISPTHAEIYDSLPQVQPDSQIIGITSLARCEDRFSMIGGLQNLFRDMKYNNVIPDGKTFGILLRLISGTDEEEEEGLMALMEKFKIKPNISFINQLIQKRCLRKDHKSAREAVHYLQKFELVPTSITFKTLAKTCRSHEDVLMLLNDMEAAVIPITHDIINTLMLGCIQRSSYVTVLHLMDICDKNGILPNMKMMEQLEISRTKIRNELIAAERECPGTNVKISDDKRKFLIEYKPWLRKTDMHKVDHPWKAYGHSADARIESLPPKKSTSQLEM